MITAAVFVEPEVVYPEQYFEATLRDLLEAVLADLGAPFAVVPHLGLDIAAFVQTHCATRVLFLEAKSFGGQRPVGVGFGNSRGEGPQVDILACDDRSLAIFANPVRWALVDATRPFGSPRYGLFTCEEVRTSVMAGVNRGKQNNFNVGKLRDGLTTWVPFCEKLTAWVQLAE